MSTELGSVTDWTTDSDLFSAQLNLVNAQEGEALSLVQLYGALGGVWE